MWGPNSIEEDSENICDTCTYEDGNWYYTYPGCGSKMTIMDERERQGLRNRILSFKNAKEYVIGENQRTPNGEEEKHYLCVVVFCKETSNNN